MPLNPMSTFDPNLPCRVHDRLNDRTFSWHTRNAATYRQYARLGSDNGQDIRLLRRADPRRMDDALNGHCLCLKSDGP